MSHLLYFTDRCSCWFLLKYHKNPNTTMTTSTRIRIKHSESIRPGENPPCWYKYFPFFPDIYRRPDWGGDFAQRQSAAVPEGRLWGARHPIFGAHHSCVGREWTRVSQRLNPALPEQGPRPHETVPQLIASRYEQEKKSTVSLDIWRKTTFYRSSFLPL